MADVEINDVAVAVAEKEVVSSSVKESPVKETNGSAKVVDEAPENGRGDKEVEKDDEPKENGDGAKDEEVKENGDSEDGAYATKRKSCGGEVGAADAVTPEKKAKLAEEEVDSPVVAEESNDAEAVEA